MDQQHLEPDETGNAALDRAMDNSINGRDAAHRRARLIKLGLEIVSTMILWVTITAFYDAQFANAVAEAGSPWPVVARTLIALVALAWLTAVHGPSRTMVRAHREMEVAAGHRLVAALDDYHGPLTGAGDRRLCRITAVLQSAITAEDRLNANRPATNRRTTASLFTALERADKALRWVRAHGPEKEESTP